MVFLTDLDFYLSKVTKKYQYYIYLYFNINYSFSVSLESRNPGSPGSNESCRNCGGESMTAFRYSLRVLQIAFYPYCSPNVKQEQNAVLAVLAVNNSINRNLIEEFHSERKTNAGRSQTTDTYI